MTSALSEEKVDEALRLTASAREQLLCHGHSRSASVPALVALQHTLRGVLQATALLHAYEASPHRSRVYAHVSRTLTRVLELRPGDDDERSVDLMNPNDPSGNPNGPSGNPNNKNGNPNDPNGNPDGPSGNPDGPSGGPDDSVPSLSPADNPARWADVIGCADAVCALRHATDLPLRFPRLFRPPRRPSRRVLLYGPPGTGKTLLAAAAAAEFRAPLLSVAPADVLSKWVGESERHVRRVFAAAARLPRCVLFLDEVDALCAARGGGGESEASRRVKTELLLRMQCPAAAHVALVAATNVPWELDAAFRRRFERHVFVGLPAAGDRRRIIEAALRGVPHALAEEDVRRVADRAGGYSAADMRRVAQYAVMAPVERIARAEFVRKVGGGAFAPCDAGDSGAVPLHEVPPEDIDAPPVTYEDFEEALRAVAATVTQEDLAKFEQWQARCAADA